MRSASWLPQATDSDESSAGSVTVWNSGDRWTCRSVSLAEGGAASYTQHGVVIEREKHKLGAVCEHAKHSAVPPGTTVASQLSIPRAVNYRKTR